MNRKKRVEISYADPKIRITNFEEVCLGYTEEEAIEEAKRCIQCKNPQCVTMCPVNIDIPKFIREIAEEDFDKSIQTLNEYSTLPAVCGRVCPQEDQCEKTCILGRKGDPISIGKLERFAADYAIAKNESSYTKAEANGYKVAIVGSGPASITCAGELAKKGYEVVMFEALHKPGGVLVYGIPEFRLPKEKVVEVEINNLKKLGVEIETNVLVGRTITIDELFEDGYHAVFIGTGAGSPIFMGIPGENFNGVLSANEFLTRSNLMSAYDKTSDTPIFVGKKVTIIGGGNVAMDAARTARRFGSEVKVIYRREKEDLPAREEEVENAIEEGIDFEFLSVPIEIIGDEKGWVEKIKCVKTRLTEADESGRKSPVPIENSQYEIETDMVVMALGTNPNTLIPNTTEGLEVDRKNRVVTKDEVITTREGVFAGGDNVTGSATVILAMGAGKIAAQEIDKYIMDKYK